MAAKTDYGAAQITVLKGLEAVRHRPAMVYCDFEDLRRYKDAVLRCPPYTAKRSSWSKCSPRMASAGASSQDSRTVA